MDRGRLDLEALAEETEEEEEWSDTDGSETEDEDGGIRRGEPNKFDSLCDGTLNATALVHASLQDLLELKDELLRHTLPPNVLVKLALTVGKVFRSVSDMNIPLDELIRMVRLYSTPWEEKSAALKKLHDQYESKKRQLNIAIQRLQLIDAHSRRMAKEKRIMNWEKLYAKLTSARGHGRRWKFLIESFKDKAKLGMDHLQAYLDNMEEPISDDEGERRRRLPREAGEVRTQIEEEDGEEEEKALVETNTESPSDEHITPEEPIAEDDESDEESSEKPQYQDSEMETEVESELSSHRHAQYDGEVPTYIRPPMKDKECWTHEPEYDRFLHVRVYAPEDIDRRDLKCSLSYGTQKQKTGILDQQAEQKTEEDDSKTGEPKDSKEASPTQSPPEPDTAASRRPQRGLIGGRGRGASTGTGRPGAARVATVQKTDANQNKKEIKPEKETKPYFEEVVFSMPVKDPTETMRAAGTLRDQLKVAVHFGSREEMISMTTIDVEDLEGLELPELIEPDPRGDVFQTKNPKTSEYEDEYTEDDKDKARDKEETLADLDPMSFPLHSLMAGRGDAGHDSAGAVPLLCYWTKKLRPRKFSRMTESQTVNELVQHMTGFDLDLVTKEQLHPKMKDGSVSPICHTPEPKEEMVPKVLYQRLSETHRKEMELLQNEYEQRLQELADSLQEMQSAQLQRQTTAPSPHRAASPPRSRSRSSPGPRGDGPSLEVSPQPPHEQQPRQRVPRSHPHRAMKNFMIGKPLPNWGEGLPKNFFDRLKIFEEESNKHRQELNDKMEQDIREALERRLAGEYKLRKGDSYNALEDVSLPAVFMPSKGSNIYNPRAHHYFHPSGSKDLRLTQPPSMVQLPPLNKNKMSVVNLFDLSQNFQRGGQEWLIQRYLNQQETAKMNRESTLGEVVTPSMARPNTMQLQRDLSAMEPAPVTPAPRQPIAESD